MMECPDVIAACNTVTPYTITVAALQTYKQIGGPAGPHNTAMIVITKAIESNTDDDFQQLCFTVATDCGCSSTQSTTTADRISTNNGTISKCIVALESGEKGSLQIIPP